MNELAEFHAHKLEELTYADLRERYLDNPVVEQVAYAGEDLTIEIEAVCDDPSEKRSLRVVVSVSGPGLGSLLPGSYSFVRAPDAS